MLGRILVATDHRHAHQSIAIARALSARGHTATVSVGWSSLADDDLEHQADITVVVALTDRAGCRLSVPDTISRLRQIPHAGAVVALLDWDAPPHLAAAAYAAGASAVLAADLDADELHARLSAVIGTRLGVNRTIHLGRLSLDTLDHTATLDGEQLALRREDVAVLARLAVARGGDCDRMLMQALYRQPVGTPEGSAGLLARLKRVQRVLGDVLVIPRHGGTYLDLVALAVADTNPLTTAEVLGTDDDLGAVPVPEPVIVAFAVAPKAQRYRGKRVPADDRQLSLFEFAPPPADYAPPAPRRTRPCPVRTPGANDNSHRMAA